MHGTAINFDPYTAAFRPPPLTGGVKLFASDWNNSAPRFDFAFRPLGGNKTVLRGGYGVFYTTMNYDAYLVLPYNPPFGNVLRFQSLPDKPTFTMDNPFPTGVGAMGAPTAWGIDPNLKTGYVQFFTSGIRREIAPNTGVEISYVGNKSTHLGKAIDTNYAPPGPGAVQEWRILRTDWGVVPVTFSSSNATYLSLQAQLERQFSKSLYLLASYGYGKALDDVANSQGDKGASQAQDPRCPHSCEKGPPAFDLRQRLTLNAIYQLQFGKGRRWLNVGGIADAFLGGWEIGSIYAKQSGRPLTITISGDPLNIGSGSPRVNYIDGATTVPDPTIDLYFNTAAFVRPANYTAGNSGRGILTGPGSDSWNFALYKTFGITERYRLQFRAEFFNFPNHVNFMNPGTTLGTASFGKITSADSARIGQFGLKFMF